MSPDLINGVFEAIGGLFIAMNVRQLLRDKTVKGVYWPATAFFTLWGLWNLFYYPSLDQWWSFAGGCVIVFFNTFWIGLVLYYKNRQPRFYCLRCTRSAVEARQEGCTLGPCPMKLIGVR